jgi:MFS family permease
MADLREDLVTVYDRARLDARYWISIALGISTSVFDYFDYYLVGFLVAVLAPQWHLTFGQTSLILLSAGVGAILGSPAWGALAELGFLPLVPAVLIALIMPESVRWLVSRGRDADARRIVTRALKVAPDKLPNRRRSRPSPGRSARALRSC